MDDTIYRSMMVQMLIRDPAMFEDDFELIADEYPWNRAYRAKN
jgi:dolichyl-diphosphooligosaccharide--protein glycosyltransferase